MTTDNWVPLNLEVRESTLTDLQRLFEAMRKSVGLGNVMTNRDCLQELLTSAVPFLTSRLRRVGRGGPSELSFHVTEDLIRELANRFPSLLIAGEATPQEGLSYIHVQNFGSKISAVGLAEYAKMAILYAVDNEAPPPGTRLPDLPTTK
jgi:hypothetical protein